MQGGNNAIIRQIARGFRRYRAYNSVNARRIYKGIYIIIA
jgi:hypothetical protein